MSDQISALSLKAQIRTAFLELFAREAALVVFVPGSIRLLGAPGDSAALTAAVDRGIWLAAAPTDNQLVTMFALNYQEQVRFQLPYLNAHASSVSGDWINLPLGAAWGLLEAGIEPVGMDIVVAGNIPTEVGLGASVAVQLACLLAWEGLGGFALDDSFKATLVHRVEQDYLGRSCDFAIPMTCLISREGHLVWVDGVNQSQLMPLAETAVLLINPGQPQKTTPPGYEAELERATAVLQQSRPQIQTTLDVTEEDVELFGHQLPEQGRRFLLHCIQENGRVLAAKTAVQHSDLTTFSRCLRLSHISIRDNLQTSSPECDLLAATAWQQPDCVGARIGSGGLMQVLVRETAVSTLQQILHEAFASQFTQSLRMFHTPLAASLKGDKNQ